MIKNTISEYFQKKWNHLKDCFTTIKPSENNSYFKEDKKGPQYQCMDCNLIFQITQESFILESSEGRGISIHKLPTQCPCGSRSYFPIDLAVPINRPLQRIERIKA